jgi:hypothetical protein
MTHLLTCLILILLGSQQGVEFGKVVLNEADGHNYMIVEGCTVVKHDNGTEEAMGGYNERCFVPIDGGTASDYDVWKEHGWGSVFLIKGDAIDAMTVSKEEAEEIQKEK